MRNLRASLLRALLRGRYLKAAACMEHRGTPIDGATHARLLKSWDAIKEKLIAAIDGEYDVFDGSTFKYDRWERYLVENDISWPLLPSGKLALDDATFRSMARAHPKVAPMHELRVALAQMRLAKLAVGYDSRNRTPFWAFSSKTGRNQPSTSNFIFGPSAWIRSLIKPGPVRRSLMLTGASRSSVSQPRCPETTLCGTPTNPVIRICSLLFRPVPHERGQPRPATKKFVHSSRSARSRCSTGWALARLHSGLVCLWLVRASFSKCIETSTEDSGNGRTPPWIMRC